MNATESHSDKFTMHISQKKRPRRVTVLELKYLNSFKSCGCNKFVIASTVINSL